MHERLSRLLLLPIRFLLLLLRQLWRILGLVGLGIRRLLSALTRAIHIHLLAPLWRLLGRMGLALRHVLGKFVWRPLLFLLTPGRLLFRRVLLPYLLAPVWRLLGRMGLALRRLLDIFFWRPFLFMSAPWRLLYSRFLHERVKRALRWLLRLPLWLLQTLARLIGWLIVRPARATIHSLQHRWQQGYKGRRRRRRLWRSRWLVLRARLRLLFTQPRPPRRAIVVPPAPAPPKPLPSPRRRVTRLATTVLAVALVVAASLITAQQAPGLRGAGAENSYQVSSSKLATQAPPTETPLPSPTPYASPTPWPTPDPLNSGGSVVFTLRQSGNSDLYALSIGQSQPVRLTDHPADDRDPAWSPDGQRVAFASHRDGNWEIYVLNLPDGELRRLTNSPDFDGGPSWSPDGEWLVFESYKADNLDLYLISADGKEGPIRLTQHPAPDYSPVWSPGGRHIAFTSWRSGNKDIYLLSLDAAADDAAINVTGTPDLQEDDPAFNMDGTALAYAEDSSGFELVYSIELDNYHPVGQPVSRGQGRHPSWSPDGKALTYIHSSSGQHHLIASSLDAWSVAPQAFTTNNRLDDPHWSARTLAQRLPGYLQQLNQTNNQDLFVETVNEPRAEGAPYLLQEVPINAPAPYLNDRVDQSFLALRQTTIDAAGWDFLGQVDQMFEALDARPLPGQSERSWAKAGRAFDYYQRYSLALDPTVEIVREDHESAAYWRTYLRAETQDGSQGEPLRELPWDFRARYGQEPIYYNQGGKLKDAIPSGYYVDFTLLAADYGWTRVPTADNWRTFFPGILFWRYEKQQALTWEEAMLEIYTPEELAPFFR